MVCGFVVAVSFPRRRCSFVLLSNRPSSSLTRAPGLRPLCYAPMRITLAASSVASGARPVSAAPAPTLAWPLRPGGGSPPRYRARHLRVAASRRSRLGGPRPFSIHTIAVQIAILLLSWFSLRRPVVFVVRLRRMWAPYPLALGTKYWAPSRPFRRRVSGRIALRQDVSILFPLLIL